MVMALPKVSFHQAPKNGLSGHDIIVVMRACGIETYTYSGSGSVKGSYLCKIRLPVDLLAQFADQEDYKVGDTAG